MIYGRDRIDDGLHAVMFPVDEVPVFAQTEPGRLDQIPGKKAIVNADSRRVFSVVSDQYTVLHNRAALELARKCCITAFPNTAPADWKVSGIEAPQTGGHCRIDLKHPGKVLTIDWAFSKGVTDKYAPFVRVTNSYNRTRVFSLHFGVERLWCRNGAIFRDALRVEVMHNRPNIERAIEAEINAAKFQKVVSEFRSLLVPLQEKEVPRDRFRAVVQSVLEIRKPQDLPADREPAWKGLQQVIEQVCDYYIEESGETAFALMNAITDLATRPPTQACGYCLDRGERHNPEHEVSPSDPRGRPYCFIRRERHSLQRLAGIWLADFGGSVRRDYDLTSYLAEPSSTELRRWAMGEPRETVNDSSRGVRRPW